MEDGHYLGVDIDEDRVKDAQACYPQHQFKKWDLTTRDVEGLEQFDSVICNNAIHHLSDAQVGNLLANFRNAAAKRGQPIDFIVMDPVLPKRPMRNLPGYFLAKMDRGEFVREADDLMKLFAAYPVTVVEHVKGSWVWPVPGLVITVAVG